MRKNKRTSSHCNYFTIIAILIACLGLFGLSAFSAEQRIKEIGVRKVLGASAGSITMLLSKDFISLVCIAILIASPLGWWAMNKWLQSFAYRTKCQLVGFCGGGFAADYNCINNSEFPGNKSGDSQPGGEFEK